ncbi:MAG: hypothetical protein R3Y59_04320 [bacterium]
MKKLIIIPIALIFIAFNLKAENASTPIIGFHPVVISENTPSNTAEYIENQIINILTRDGIALNSGDFIFEISINEISKQITSTAPAQVQLRLEVVVNAIDKRQSIVLNSITMMGAGIDKTENRAYMTAIRNLNFRNRNFLNFVEVSKNRLLEYYDFAYTDETTEEQTTSIPEEEEIEFDYLPITNEDTPIVEETPILQSHLGVELADGIFVEYIRTEKKSETTDVILKFTNYNDRDEAIFIKGKGHMVIDSNGRNIKSNNEKYLNGEALPSYSSLMLIKDVPVSIRINYPGDITPQVMFLYEGQRDVKVRIEIK